MRLCVFARDIPNLGCGAATLGSPWGSLNGAQAHPTYPSLRENSSFVSFVVKTLFRLRLCCAKFFAVKSFFVLLLLKISPARANFSVARNLPRRGFTRAKHVLSLVEGSPSSQSDGANPSSRANARDLRKISPFGRNDNAPLCPSTLLRVVSLSNHAFARKVFLRDLRAFVVKTIFWLWLAALCAS